MSQATRPWAFAALWLVGSLASSGHADPAPAAAPRAAASAAASGEAPALETSVCRLIEAAALPHHLPVAFLTRLIWQESSFRPKVTSPAGAQGIAQFMPGTAGARGLADPFDPQAAIPQAAALLDELAQRFGNLGLAAAAYNAGPGRVAAWLAGAGGLPDETRDYVLSVTRHPVEDWRGGAAAPAAPAAPAGPEPSCLKTAAALRRRDPARLAGSVLVAPWCIQVAGSFSKAAALAAYGRAKDRYAAILGKVAPMVVGGIVPSLGFRPYYRIVAPAPSRAQAGALCAAILRTGGACSDLKWPRRGRPLPHGA